MEGNVGCEFQDNLLDISDDDGMKRRTMSIKTANAKHYGSNRSHDGSDHTMDDYGMGLVP